MYSQARLPNNREPNWLDYFIVFLIVVIVILGITRFFHVLK